MVCDRCGRHKVERWSRAEIDPQIVSDMPTWGTTRNTWPRNRSTDPGGASTPVPVAELRQVLGSPRSPRGWALHRPRGWALSLPGGGLSTSDGANSYRSNQPPMHVLIPHLRRIGKNSIADKLARARHKLNL
jgi:hypothetical protein